MDDLANSAAGPNAGYLSHNFIARLQFRDGIYNNLDDQEQYARHCKERPPPHRLKLDMKKLSFDVKKIAERVSLQRSVVRASKLLQDKLE